MDSGAILTGLLAVVAAVPGAVSAALACLLVAAACIDARERRVPNELALALCAAGLFSCAVCSQGLLLWHVLAATVFCGALAAFELLWRRHRGAPGIGMGDVKVLFALMLASPLRGAGSFALGLVLLAAACAVARRRSLPLVPFIAAAWFALSLVGVF